MNSPTPWPSSHATSLPSADQISFPEPKPCGPVKLAPFGKVARVLTDPLPARRSTDVDVAYRSAGAGAAGGGGAGCPVGLATMTAPAAAAAITTPAVTAALTAPTFPCGRWRRREIRCTVLPPCAAPGPPEGHKAASSSAA